MHLVLQACNNILLTASVASIRGNCGFGTRESSVGCATPTHHRPYWPTHILDFYQRLLQLYTFFMYSEEFL